MQAPFSLTQPSLAAVQTTLAQARFTKYLHACHNDWQATVQLYRWNTLLCQSLWWPLQTLEIASRNSISRILAERFGPRWHFSDKLRGALSREDRDKLLDAIDRQIKERHMAYPPIDAVIADLSFGFWTSMLTNRYDVPIGWARRLTNAYPHLPNGYTRQAIWRQMEDVRNLRNRIAHHEPIFYLPVEARYQTIAQLLSWICPYTAWFVEQTCAFAQTIEIKPHFYLPVALRR